MFRSLLSPMTRWYHPWWEQAGSPCIKSSLESYTIWVVSLSLCISTEKKRKITGTLNCKESAKLFCVEGPNPCVALGQGCASDLTSLGLAQCWRAPSREGWDLVTPMLLLSRAALHFSPQGKHFWIMQANLLMRTFWPEWEMSSHANAGGYIGYHDILSNPLS